MFKNAISSFSKLGRVGVRGMSTPALSPNPYIYSSYKVYKTKTALDVSVARPKVGTAGREPKTYTVLKRPGTFKFTFASSSAGFERQYDWGASQFIMLSVPELGELLAFIAAPQQQEMKLFHDPQLKTEAQGQVRKELVIKRFAGTGGARGGYYFNLSVTQKDDKESSVNSRWSIAVTEGEIHVLQTLIQQLMPQLLCMDARFQFENEENKTDA